jgi:LysM repeat protein
VLVVLLVAALLLLAFSLGRVSPSASTASAPRPAPRSVVVQPGDTLWEIAVGVAPSVDPRVTVERIIDRNGLSAPALRAGQSLVLPRAP